MTTRKQMIDAAFELIDDLNKKQVVKLSSRSDRNDEEFVQRLRENVEQTVKVYAGDVADQQGISEKAILLGLAQVGEATVKMADRLKNGELDKLVGDETYVEAQVWLRLNAVVLSFGFDSSTEKQEVLDYFSSQSTDFGKLLTTAALERALELIIEDKA
jgi:hypothetical protein